MKIFVVNAGSSSLKYQLIDMTDKKVIAKGLCDRIGLESGEVSLKNAAGDKFEKEMVLPNHTVAFNAVIEMMTSGESKVIDSLSEISAVGHRVVQGGAIFKESTLIDADVMDKIDGLSSLAPLHNPAHIQGMRACIDVLGKDVPQVAVFDTSFHATMPDYAYIFPLPYEYYEKYAVRRYGAHGTSHRCIANRLINECGIGTPSKIITCHLGNGSSITAIRDGKVIDTSMGLTPLEGLVMGTRCGDLDPSIIEFIANKENLSISEVLNILNKKSGVQGMSKVSSDFRDLEAAYNEGNELAIDAVEVFAYRVAKYIGSYVAAMNGVDAIAFTAGIGENTQFVREKIVAYLGYLGITLDKEVNKATYWGVEGYISTPDSKVKVCVIPTDEELAICRDTVALVEGK